MTQVVLRPGGLKVTTMTIQYMNDGFAPHVDRGFQTAKTRLEPSRLDWDQDGESAKHSRALVEHILPLNLNVSLPSQPNFLLRRLPWRTPCGKPREEGPLRRSAPGTFGRSSRI